MHLCVCVSVCVCCTHEYNVLKGQKKVSDPLELDLHTVASSLTWLLGIELGFS